jgi:chemotaxis protein CheC
MMESVLSETQRDALTEMVNIGFGRAASSLSRLTGDRVELEAPNVAVYPAKELRQMLGDVLRDEIVTVHQVFSGPVAGDALLVLDAPGAALLKELLTGETALPLAVDASAQEVVTEVGNIVLNACLGMFGTLLEVHVSFSVPRLTLEGLSAVLDSVNVQRQGLRYGLVVHAAFKVRHGSVTGYLVIILSVTSLDRLLLAVEAWRQRQTGER